MGLDWWIVYIGIPLVATLFGADFYIHRNAADEREKAITAKDAEIDALRKEKDAAIDALHARVNATNKEFSDYKVNAAMLFSTVGAVESVKRELITQMTSMKGELSVGLTYIVQRLDRLVERNERKDN